MKIKIGDSYKLNKYRKTHLYYMCTDKKGNPYYKAIPKISKVNKVKGKVDEYRKEKKLFWPVLGLLTLIVFPIALHLGNKPETGAITDPIISEPTIEVLEPMEQMEEPKLGELSSTYQTNQTKVNKSNNYSGVCSEYYDLVSQYDWDVNIALAIMKAESGCNPDAVGYNTNGTSDHGLFQLNSAYWNTSHDPATNIKEAYRVYSRSGGWTPWSVYNSGKYLQYL